MPDISKINALAIGNVSKVDGLAKVSILDINGITAIAAPAAAYSVRLLDIEVGIRTYTGVAMRVRRETGGGTGDDDEADIAFDSGVISLDSAISNASAGVTATTLGQFINVGTVGGTTYTNPDSLTVTASCLVNTWMDQSGNAKDATQATQGSQPQIHDGTVNTDLITDNGKPALEFDGVNDGYLLDTTGLDIGSISSLTVGRMLSISLSVMFGLSGTTNNRRWYAPLISSGTFSYGYATVAQAITTPEDTNQNLHTMIAGTTLNGVEAFLNGTSVGTTTRTTGSVSGEDGIANLNGGFYANCNVQEVIFYGSDQSSNRTAIETDVNTYFSIF